MTPNEAFDAGNLSEAIALQEALASRDPVERLLLVQLLMFAGQLAEARSHLALINSDEPGWPELARSILRLMRAQRRRDAGRRPLIRPEPIPTHAKRRWLAIKAIRDARPDDATRLIDRADASTPDVRGFLDGMEFDRLRDADDRFASVLEAVVGGEPVWFPWEAVRTLRLEPVRHLRDQLVRPAELRLADGSTVPVHIPLVYPRSHEADGAFACGLETDFVCPDGGPARCVGGKLLFVGDGAEHPLAAVRMIEIRGA